MQLNVVPSYEFSACFVQFLESCENCVAVNRDYFEGKVEQISSYLMHVCSHRPSPVTLLFGLICSGYLGVKQPGCEIDNSPPPSDKLKNVCSHTTIPFYVFMLWCVVKHGVTYICRHLLLLNINQWQS